MAEKIAIFTGVTTMVQEFVAKPALLTLRALIDIVQYKQHVSPVTEYRSFIRPGMHIFIRCTHAHTHACMQIANGQGSHWLTCRESNEYSYMRDEPFWYIWQILFTLLTFTQSADNMLHSVTVPCENGCFLISNVSSCPLVQGFPHCGPRPSGGPRDGLRWSQGTTQCPR